jgi:hypothetical protein
VVVVQAGFGIKILARVAQIERDRAGGFGVAVRGDGPFPNRGVVTCAAQGSSGYRNSQVVHCAYFFTVLLLYR